MRILVSGGGTAGHISPILATVDALKSLDKALDILYVGMGGGMEAKLAANAGLSFAPIKAGKLRRYHAASIGRTITDLPTLGLNVRDSGRVALGVLQSLTIIKNFKPDVIFIKGGFVGLPVGVAARLLKVPYVIHESDTIPGLTNRLLAPHAVKIAVGFPVDKYRDLPRAKLVYTGIPVRAQTSRAHRLEGIARFKLDDKLPTILITGGSQGAVSINKAVLPALPELTKRYQVIHLTGEFDIERVRFEVKRLALEHPARYQAHSFLLNDFELALAVADLVVSRAGANAIADLAALSKPTILIPGGHLSGGHQTSNAVALARSGAVRTIPEHKLTPQSLVAEIDRIINSPEDQRYLAEGIKKYSRPDAAEVLARTILAVGEGAAS